MLLAETLEQALQLAREGYQGVPGPVQCEVVAAGVDQVHLAPVLRERTEHLQLAGEELLVQNRKLDVLLNGLDAADADAEVVDVAAQHAPHGTPLSAAGQRGGIGDVMAIVG